MYCYFRFPLKTRNEDASRMTGDDRGEAQ